MAGVRGEMGWRQSDLCVVQLESILQDPQG